jgi:4'-phosphopantetheinyl transferase EntD
VTATDGGVSLEGLLDADVRAAASTLVAGPDALLPEERACVARAVEKRRREFAQGRVLARRLLADLGAAGGPLLPDADRVPRWPAGIVGSISHTDDLCVVAAAREGDVLGLGVDVEPEGPLGADLEARIATPTERAWLSGRGTERARHLLRALFSVKECVYKACFPRTRERWGFQDLEVALAPEDEAFRAEPRVGALAGRPLAGRVARRGGYWIATFALRREDAPALAPTKGVRR